MPTADELYAATPLPWASGRSWLHGVENGMSGLGKYMYSTDFPTSRSGAGIQTKSEKGGSLMGVTYLTNGGILDEFRESLIKLSSTKQIITTG